MPKAISSMVTGCLLSIAMVLGVGVRAQERLPLSGYSGDFLASPSVELDYEDSDIPSIRNTYAYYNKRFVPHWYHSLNSRDYDRYSSPIAEMKRFLPFHPLARFRGLSMGGSSGGAGGGGVSGGTLMSASYPMRHRQSFDTYVSSSSQPSPGHPVPSDGKPLEEEGQIGNENLSEEDVTSGQDGKSQEKISAGDILRYLNSVSHSKFAPGKAKVFRYGIK